MKLSQKVKRSFYRRIMKPNIKKVYEKENSVADYPNAITAIDDAPIRFNIPMSIIDLAEHGEPNNLANRLTILPMISNIRNIKKSILSIKRNVSNPRTEMDDNSIKKLKEYCRSLGIASVGFIKLSQNLIFKEKTVLFDNAIVLTMEMDKDRINLAPHIKTGETIMQTYNSLGIAANKIASYLRKEEYCAQASHPLGGLVLYPPLSIKAGLGWNGRHGLLITPEYGPRVRIAAVFTNIRNLPVNKENPHSWIPRFCESCGICIRSCPTNSLHEKPIQHENGLVTHNDSEKCFPYFASHYGCTICIKVCPFSTPGAYYKLKKKFSQ